MIFIGLLFHIQECLQKYKTRKALAGLNHQQLIDIAISEQSRAKEARKGTLMTLIREVCAFRFKKRGC